MTTKQLKKDWVAQICDWTEQNVQHQKGENATIICASGISPSGPVHLGNLREVMTVHLVAEELRTRGCPVEHLHFWDDYDRLRKIPTGVPEEFARHLGRPLADVPDPFGEYASYADRYISDFTSGLEQLGIVPRYIRQSVEYRQGRYAQQTKDAMARRGEIFDILDPIRPVKGNRRGWTSAEMRITLIVCIVRIVRKTDNDHQLRRGQSYHQL